MPVGILASGQGVPSAAGVVVGREDLGRPPRAGVLEVRLEVDLIRVRVRVRVRLGC